MKKGNPKTIYLKDYTPPPYLIDAVDLKFDLREEHADVQAKLSVRRNPAAREPKRHLELNGEGLALLGIKLDGAALDANGFEHTESGLTVFDVPERFELETLSRIEPQKNTALEGLYKSAG